MRSVIPNPLPLPQSARAGALSPTAKPLLQPEWRLNIPWNQSSLAFWMHSQSPWTFHMLMWVLFISFVALVGQWCHAEGRWIKLVNLRLFSAYFRPPLSFYRHLFQPGHNPPLSYRGLNKHRWSLLTCYSSLCQKLCQSNAPSTTALKDFVCFHWWALLISKPSH